MRIYFIDISQINLNNEIIGKCLDLCVEEEKERFKRITSEKVKINFLLGRYLIRTILAGVLNCNPNEVALTKTEKGRLELKHLSSPSFNISHSNDITILAIDDTQIGIDVEYIRNRNFLEIAESFFSDEESKSLKNLKSPISIRNLFYTYWTLKEAFIKCNGDGLFNKKMELKCRLDNNKIQSSINDKYQLASFKIKEKYLMSVVAKLGKPDNFLKTSYEITKVIPFGVSQIIEIPLLFGSN